MAGKVENFEFKCKACQNTRVHIDMIVVGITLQVTFICLGCNIREQHNLPQPNIPPPPGIMYPFMPGGFMPIKEFRTEGKIETPEPEPEKPEPSKKSKLMQKIIDSEDMKLLGKHKYDFEEWEYRYIIDTIKTNKEKRNAKSKD